MSILAADDNGGRYNTVHRQTDDGIVISVVSGRNLMPLVFRYTDYLGDVKCSLLSATHYPHKRLMRHDCGWRREDDSGVLTFSWEEMRHVTDGISDSPSGEYSESWHDEPNCAKDVALKGIKRHRAKFYRKDREYWTPGQTLAGDTYEDYFGWSQFNPMACDPVKPDKCGLVQYKGELH